MFKLNLAEYSVYRFLPPIEYPIVASAALIYKRVKPPRPPKKQTKARFVKRAIPSREQVG